MNKGIKGYMELRLQEYEFAEPGNQEKVRPGNGREAGLGHKSHAAVIREACFKYSPDFATPDSDNNTCAGISRVLQ